MKCLNCKKELFIKYPCLIKTKKFCSRSCLAKFKKGSLNPHWKGGISNFDGYLMITHGDDIYTFQHRKIMEDHLGRKLSSNEIVHHKNENRKDNRIQNLEIMSRAEHQRHHKPRLGTGKTKKEIK